MTPHHIRLAGGRFRHRTAHRQADTPGRMLPLHKMPNICCTTGACREVEYWPMGFPQEGWLQLEQTGSEAAPVDLFAFSCRGVGIILTADVPLHQGARGVLMTQAHGAGLSHRTVRCCWCRPHPQDPQRQCAGLRFESNEQG